MPRVTRAALRLNAMLEDTNLAASTPLPLTPFPLRAPLGEITGNSEEVKAMVNDLEQLVKSQKKAPPKGRQGKVQKNERKLPHNTRSEESVEVIEDDNQSATSSAVDEACQELMKEPSGGIHQVVIHDQRPRAPPSPAVTVVKKHLSTKAKTQKADPTATRSATMALPSAQKLDKKATNPTNAEPPVLFTSPESIEKEQGHDERKENKGNDDLTLDQIMARSPAQLITRIEDSVEAIDAFEEAIEKVGELIPAISEGRRSPTTVTKAGDATHESNDGNTGSNKSNPTGSTKAARPSNVKSRRMTTRAASAFQRRNTTHMSPRLTSKTVDGSDRGLAPGINSTSSAADATSTRTNPKRISSIHRAPFQPTKSTKPPTRSTFELPGEAVARKLKEQRDERLKRGEEEPAKKPVLRSRPARLSQAPVVRQTTTSNARLSLAKTDFKKASPLRERASAINSLSRQSTSNAEGHKRLSTLFQAKRIQPSLTTNTTRPVGLRSSTIVTTPHVIGVPGPSRAPIAAPDAVQLKLRGKEVFNRNRVELDERERARKEKEEAARKARAEAAERGRIASREWAEKQRMKKMAMEKENQGDRAIMGH